MGEARKQIRDAYVNGKEAAFADMYGPKLSLTKWAFDEMFNGNPAHRGRKFDRLSMQLSPYTLNWSGVFDINRTGAKLKGERLDAIVRRALEHNEVETIAERAATEATEATQALLASQFEAVAKLRAIAIEACRVAVGALDESLITHDANCHCGPCMAYDRAVSLVEQVRKT